MDGYRIKGVLHLLPKISMFCALSQNYQHLFEIKKKYASYSELYKEVKNSIKSNVGQVVLELLIQQHFDGFDP